MIKPPNLRAGDKIAIVAPAKCINEDAVNEALEIFQQWDLNVVMGQHLFCTFNQFAGKDEQRLVDFQKAIDDPVIKAIFCVRGGYGTTRIIDKINFKSLTKHPKWIIGYSDITALLCHLHNVGVESIHGIMPALFGNKGVEKSIESLRAILYGESISHYVKPFSLNRKGDVRATLLGGNLSLLCHIIGSDSDVIMDDCILFIEDIGEYKYSIDRMMVQLKRAGKLQNLAGLIIGHFTDIKDNEDEFGKSVNEIIYDHVKDYDYPLCFGFPSGHENLNLALPISRKCQLKVDKFGGMLAFKT